MAFLFFSLRDRDARSVTLSRREEDTREKDKKRQRGRERNVFLSLSPPLSFSFDFEKTVDNKIAHASFNSFSHTSTPHQNRSTRPSAPSRLQSRSGRLVRRTSNLTDHGIWFLVFVDGSEAKHHLVRFGLKNRRPLAFLSLTSLLPPPPPPPSHPKKTPQKQRTASSTST